MCHKKAQSRGHGVTARMMYITIFYIPPKQWLKFCVRQLRIYFSSYVFEEALMWLDCVPRHKNRTESRQRELKYDKSPKQMLLPRCRHTLTNCFVVLKSHHTIRMKNKNNTDSKSNKQTTANLL